MEAYFGSYSFKMLPVPNLIFESMLKVLISPRVCIVYLFIFKPIISLSNHIHITCFKMSALPVTIAHVRLTNGLMYNAATQALFFFLSLT